MGLLMGYTMYFFLPNFVPRVFMTRMEYWPFIAAAVTASVVSILMTVIKYVYNKFIFEHFYFMTLGIICQFIGGAIMIGRTCEY